MAKTAKTDRPSHKVIQTETKTGKEAYICSCWIMIHRMTQMSDEKWEAKKQIFFKRHSFPLP